MTLTLIYLVIKRCSYIEAHGVYYSFTHIPSTMAPLDVPHHWKQIKQFTKFEIADVDDPGDQDEQNDSEEDSDTDTASLLNVSDVEDVIAFVLHGDITDDESAEFNSSDDEVSMEDSPTYDPLPEEYQSVTPLRQNVPDARRRLFETSGGEEDDDDEVDDGIAYL